jgi:hypothetical protein
MNLLTRVSLTVFMENNIVDEFSSRVIKPRNSRFLLSMFKVLEESKDKPEFLLLDKCAQEQRIKDIIENKGKRTVDILTEVHNYMNVNLMTINYFEQTILQFVVDNN